MTLVCSVVSVTQASRWASMLGYLGGGGTMLLTLWWFGAVIAATYDSMFFIAVFGLLIVPIGPVAFNGLVACVGALAVTQQAPAIGARLLFLSGLCNGLLALGLGMGAVRLVSVSALPQLELIAGAGSMATFLAAGLAWNADA